MGFTHLNGFIDDYYKSSTNIVNIEDFWGKIVVPDFSQVMNNKCRGQLSRGSYMTRRDGKKINHINAIFEIAMQFLAEGVVPFYVFDNKTPKAKLRIVAER